MTGPAMSKMLDPVAIGLIMAGVVRSVRRERALAELAVMRLTDCGGHFKECSLCGAFAAVSSY